MKKSTLSLSLLIGAALTIPSLAMAAPTDTAAMEKQAAATATTLEAEGDNVNNESAANQSSPFQISETQVISRAKVNNSPNQQQMTTELQADQEAMQLQQAAIQNPEDAMQQQDLQDEMLEEEATLETE